MRMVTIVVIVVSEDHNLAMKWPLLTAECHKLAGEWLS